jgi:hypothetical protein
MNIRDLPDDVLKQIIRDALPFSGDLPFPDLPDANDPPPDWPPDLHYYPPNRTVGKERRWRDHYNLAQEIEQIYDDLLYMDLLSSPALDTFNNKLGDVNQKNKKLTNMNAQNLLEMLLLNPQNDEKNPQNDEKMILPNIKNKLESQVPTKKQKLQKRLTASRSRSEEVHEQLHTQHIDDADERAAALQLYRDELHLQDDLEDAIDDLSNQVQALNVEGSGFSFPSLL